MLLGFFPGGNMLVSFFGVKLAKHLPGSSFLYRFEKGAFLMAESFPILTCIDCGSWCGRCGNPDLASKRQYRVASSEACEKFSVRKIRKET